MNISPKPLDEPSKQADDLVGLSHLPLANKIHTLTNAIARKKPRYNMNGLVEENLGSWILHNLGHIRFRKFGPYPDYTQFLEENGVYPLQTKNDTGEITISLLSDWASDTEEAMRIADMAGIQDYSIHMGDTYYTGSASEIADNFDDEKGAAWKYGNIGSFAMLGNHEMYSGGDSYFTSLLPFMGLYYGDDRKPKIKQKASFFCLENNFWRIIALDTGYDSLKGIFRTGNNHLELGDKQIAWLTNIVFANPADKRGIIFLSHHQPHSAFEGEFRKPIEALTPLIGSNRNVLWFCGHEHRMAMYGISPLKWNSGYYLRCIGHAGMPVEFKNVERSDRNLVLYDARVKRTINRFILKDIQIGHNGFVVLRLHNELLTADYYDDDRDPGPLQTNVSAKKLVTEQWKIDLQSGKLTGISISDLTAGNEEQKQLRKVQRAEQAIGKQ